MSVTPDAGEAEASEPARLVTALIQTYDAFSALQQQKLRMASSVLDMQEVINDPVAAARSILVARYSHFDEGKLDEALAEVARCLSLEEDEAGKPVFSGDFPAAVKRCDEILPDGFGRACMLTYMQQALELQRSGGDAEDLRASLFTGVVADFESFLVQFLTALYTDKPRKLATKDRTVSWGQVFSIENIDDFHEELIDEAVVEIMRGSFRDWMLALKKDHGVDVEHYTKSPHMVELFQRRHVIVHNGGYASRLYVEKVPEFKVQRGDRLAVDQEYFQRAADNLAVVALALTVNALLTVAKEPAMDVEIQMTNWVYELLLRRRYQAVHDYLAGVPFDRMVNHSSRETSRSNMWLALKRLDRFDECRDEIETWQVDHLGNKFKLAKHALLGELEEASVLCRAMRDNGDLALRHWVEWPMLEEVRMYQQTVPDEGVVEADIVDEIETFDGGPADEH